MEKIASNGHSDIEKRAEDPSRVSLSEDGAKVAAAATSSAIEKRVWLKLDLWLLPVVSMFYFLSFLVSFMTSSFRFPE